MSVKWTGLYLGLVAAMVVAGGCRRGNDRGALPASVSLPRPANPVLAEINGLTVLRSDFLASLRAGRVTGSPELVLDELLSFRLVLRECEAMGAGETCGGSDPVHVRAIRFLERLYPEADVCGSISDEDYRNGLGRLITRGSGLEGDPGEPGSRKIVKERICRSRARQVRRQWVTALRKGARVRIHEEAFRAAVQDAPL